MNVQLEYWFAGYDAEGKQIEATTPAQFLIALRDIRDILLKESDWIMTIDSPISGTPEQQQWIEWRQLLRDLPSNYDETTITPIIEVIDPPLISRPRSWYVLTSEYREAMIESYQNADAVD
jgi:hypothetical protein